MRPADLKSEVLPALLLGLARRRPDYARFAGALPSDDRAADLKAAALLSQALRLERPPAPPDYAVDEPVAGGRARIPEEARAAFVRLFGSGRGGLPVHDPLAAAMASALDRLSLAPHPFDFHRLEPFLRAHADKLGAAVAAWLDREVAGDRTSGYFDGEALTDEDWALAAPARRERYVRERRRTDPAAARALVEAVWASEKAEMRLRLLRALGGRVSDDDRPFLEGLATDRAPTVRDVAAYLLALLDGRDDGGPALKAVLDRIRQEKAGFLRRRAVLKLELPANVQANDGLRWIRTAFAPIDLGALLKALGMEADQAIEAAGDDEWLLAAFATMAMGARRFDVLARISRLSAAPVLLLAGGFPGETDFAAADARDFAAAVFSAGPDVPATVLAQALQTFQALTDAPLPAEVFDAVARRSEGVLTGDDAAVRSPLLTSLAIVAPASRRQAVRSAATGLPDGGGPVVAWLDLLDRLEKGIPR
jgi:hypothetical protein